ncbi:MAG: hypothetical protein IBX50_10770 [Marinospirillum sp.]|uniref:hypothetical protein n=1 Tax=Marinospirillum sp. TaxID=2183934 RepID=UPI0019DEE31F|nr:hypothetical protein [Marinospirillum sp.]MBE0507186.1 hypothetical protein [Marinospirillum sp.]
MATQLLTRSALLLVLALLPVMAQAHYPVMDCSRDSDRINCRIGYSDGTLAHGQEVVMYSYADEELVRVKADGRSEAHFDWYEGEFYIQFDAGHEDPAEFDYVEF